jgi:hypothetical protein
MQWARFGLVINAQTARTPTLLALTDEVIE